MRHQFQKFCVIVIVGMVMLVCGLIPVATSASEIDAASRLYDKHQKLSLGVAHKLQKLRQDYNGRLERAPATLVVPLIDQAIGHLRWAKAYAPNEASRKIIEFNAYKLRRLRAKIVEGQGGKPAKKGVCTGNDKWITA
jgi:hypothetical protein